MRSQLSCLFPKHRCLTPLAIGIASHNAPPRDATSTRPHHLPVARWRLLPRGLLEEVRVQRSEGVLRVRIAGFRAQRHESHGLPDMGQPSKVMAIVMSTEQNRTLLHPR